MVPLVLTLGKNRRPMTLGLRIARELGENYVRANNVTVGQMVLKGTGQGAFATARGPMRR